MAYLNAQEREKLAQQLVNMKFRRAKGKVRRMDRNSRLIYMRNSQSINQWATRYELPNLGTIVTLIEDHALRGDGKKKESDFDLVQVVVEPMPDNKT